MSRSMIKCVWVIFVVQAIACVSLQAQSTLSLSTKELIERAQEVSELPTPQPRYELVHWEWLKKTRSNTKKDQATVKEERDSQDEDAIDASIEKEKDINLESTTDKHSASTWSLVQNKLKDIFAQQGQAHLTSLHEDRKQRSNRRASMDLFTQSAQERIPYVVDFEPSVAPFKRETVWNEIDPQGQLKINVGRIKVVEPLIVAEIEQCVRSQTTVKNTHSKTHRYLILNSQHWINQEHLDFSCIQKLCAMRGGACFITRITNIPQRTLYDYLSVPSVSAEQYLLSSSEDHFFTMGKDQADNYYIKYKSRTTKVNTKVKYNTIYYLVYAPYRYFSGSWVFNTPIAHADLHIDTLLPPKYRTQARSLFALLGLKPHGVFHTEFYRLVEWFRSFQNKIIHSKLDGSTYEKLTRSQRGVCRHRSYAFMITARALGLPTRYITNQTHAFVEILDPENHWRRVDLGGEGAFQVQNNETQQSMTGKQGHLYQASDGLPQPKFYQQNTENTQLLLEKHIQEQGQSRQVGLTPSAVTSTLSQSAQSDPLSVNTSYKSPNKVDQQKQNYSKLASQKTPKHDTIHHPYVEDISYEVSDHQKKLEQRLTQVIDTLDHEAVVLRLDQNGQLSPTTSYRSVGQSKSKSNTEVSKELGSHTKELESHTKELESHTMTTSLSTSSKSLSNNSLKDTFTHTSLNDPKSAASQSANALVQDTLTQELKTMSTKENTPSTDLVVEGKHTNTSLSYELETLEKDRDGGHPLVEEKGLFIPKKCKNTLRSFRKPKIPKVWKKSTAKLLEISMQVPAHLALTRCESFMIKGKVKAGRRGVAGIVVQAYLINHGDIIPLPAWTKSTRHGSFKVKVQLPSHLPLGHFEIVIHAPAQRKWRASWSRSPKDIIHLNQ